MRVDTFPVGALLANAFVLTSREEAVVVDPGGVSDELRRALDGVSVVYLLLTHSHFDHTDGALELQRLTGAGIAYHPAERPVFTAMGQDPLPLDRALEEGTRLSVGGEELVVWHLPGHSPGSVAYVWETGKTVLCGDVVFAGSVGRSDLPGGDWPTLARSLRRLLSLPDDWVLLPGHGPRTTVGFERKENPFLRGIDDGAP